MPRHRPSPAPSDRPAIRSSARSSRPCPTGLRVRSQPRVSDDSKKFEPLLPLGTELEVVGGPVTGSGYVWYEVAPVSFALTGGADRGWVAMGDHDGTPWIAVAEPPITGIEIAMSQVDRLPADPKDAKAAAASVTAFGLDLYRRLLADPDLSGSNVVFSPTSIALALGMARAGAKGTTASEMDDVLHTAGWAELGPGLNALDQAIVSRDGAYKDDEGKTHQLALRIANSTFAQHGWSMEQPFLDAIAAAFGAGVQLVDYQADPEAARKTINAWVSRQTERRIPELLGTPDVTDATRLYLVNAMYLKANWVTEFDKEATTPRAFIRLDGSTRQGPDDATPRRAGSPVRPGRRLARHRAPLPRSRRHLPARDGPDHARRTSTSFEAELTPKQLAGITKALTKERVRLNEDIRGGRPMDDCGSYPYSLTLRMPKFGDRDAREARRHPRRARDADGLRCRLGRLHRDPRPDPRRVDPHRERHPPGEHRRRRDRDRSGRRHRHRMDTGGCTGPQPAKDVTFRLDHPFLFVLRDLETGAILFMGRVVDPSIAR